MSDNEEPKLDDETLKLYVEMWKQTVEVQMHFNDIEWKIRGLAMTVLTFALGGASLALRENSSIAILSFEISLASAVLIVGLILWVAFYFVDAGWYHRLLIGAVRHGEALETELRRMLPVTGLTHEITAYSSYTMTVALPWRRRIVVILHSSTKLKVFYSTVACVLLIAAVLIQIGASK